MEEKIKLMIENIESSNLLKFNSAIEVIETYANKLNIPMKEVENYLLNVWKKNLKNR